MDRNRLFYNNTTTTITTPLSHYYPQVSSQTSNTVSDQNEESNEKQYVDDQVLLPNSSGDAVRGTEHLKQEEEGEEEEEADTEMSLSARLCSVKGCPTTLDEGDSNKMCQHCRGRHRIYASTKRTKRKMEKAALAQAVVAVTIPGVHTSSSSSHTQSKTFNDNLFASAQESESSGTPSASDGTWVSPPAMVEVTSWENEAPLTRLAGLLGTSRVHSDTTSGSWQNAIDPCLFDAKLSSSGVDSPHDQHPTVSSSSTLAHALTPVRRTVQPPPPPIEGVLAHEEEEEENEVLATLQAEQPLLPESKALLEEVPEPENELADDDGDSTARVCSVRGCKASMEASYEYKMCPHCRVRYQKYGTTKRAKWKAEGEAFDRALAVLRKKEDSRRKNEGLLPLSNSPEELRQWELSILDQELPLPDIQTLADVTLTTASGSHSITQGAGFTPSLTQPAHHSTLSTPTSLELVAISPVIAAGVYQSHLTSNSDENGEPMSIDSDVNPGNTIIQPLLVGHLAPYVEDIASSASGANKVERNKASTKTEETPASAPHDPSVDISSSESPQLAYPDSPGFSQQHQAGDNAASPMSSDTSMAPDLPSHPVLASFPLSTPGLTPLPARMCTVSHCHRVLPGYYRYKRCEQHRLQNRYHSQLKRVREKGGDTGCNASSSSPSIPSTPSSALAGGPTIPGISGPSREDVSSPMLPHGATELMPYLEQTTVGASGGSLSVCSVDSRPQTSTCMTTQTQEGSSHAGPSSYDRHMSDPVEDAKALASIMAEEDIKGVYAFREKMRKRLLERKPRRPNSKANVANKNEATPHNSAETNESSSGTEIPRQRKPKISKTLHLKASTVCFRSSCHNLVHPEYTFKSCVQCREADRDRKMFARLGPNRMAELQTTNQPEAGGAPPVQGILDWELGVITQRQTRWTPQLERSASAIDSHNSEMDAEGEFDKDSSDSAPEEDNNNDTVEDAKDASPTQPIPLSADPSEETQVSSSSALLSKPPDIPIRSETTQDLLDPTIVETLPPQSAFGRFRLQHTPFSDSLSYPTTPYYSLMPPRYTPNPVNPPLNPVYIPFLPNPIGNTTRNGATNGSNNVNNSDLPPAHDSDVESRTKAGSPIQGLTTAADEPDKHATLTNNPTDSAALTGLDGASMSSTTASPSVKALKSCVAPNLDLSAFSSNPAVAVIGRILAMNPKMPINAFTEVLAIEANKTLSTNGSGSGVKEAEVRGGTLMWKGAGSGQKRGKGKQKPGAPVPQSENIEQPSTSLEGVVSVPQNTPSHWRGEIIMGVKPGEGAAENQIQKPKGKAKSTPSKYAEQEAFENSWKTDAPISVGPITYSTSVLPRVVAAPSSNLPARSGSRQTTAGSSKQGSGNSTTTKANTSATPGPLNPQVSGPAGTPSTLIQSATGASQYMAYGSYPYHPVTSQTSYQHSYYPYYYPPYSTYAYPPFSGNVPMSSSSLPPPPHVPLEPQTIQPDTKSTRKRKTRKGDVAAANPLPLLESCCSSAVIDSTPPMHMYPPYPYPTSPYPPPYGYVPSSYNSAYMQSSYYYPMSTGTGYPYTYPLPTSASTFVPPPSSTPPLESVSKPRKSNSKGKEKQGPKEAVPDKGPRKRQKFDADYLESYRAQTRQIQETLERNAQISLGGSTSNQPTIALAIVNSASITQAQPLMQDISQPASPAPHDENSDKMGEDQTPSEGPADEPTAATTDTGVPRKCGYPSCRRTIPADVHKMLCDRCRTRIKKEAERTKQKHRLQPRKSLNLLGNKRYGLRSLMTRGERADEVVLD